MTDLLGTHASRRDVHRRTGRRLLALSASFVLVLSSAGIAFADLQQVDNDFATNGLDNSHDFGSVSPGQALGTTAQVAINYQGNNHLAAGDVVPFDVSAGQTNLPAGYSVSSVSITIPSPWSATSGPDSNGLVGALSTINFTAPTTPGPFTFTVKWQVGSPHPACIDVNPSCLSDSPGGGPAFTVTGNVAVADCSPDWQVGQFFQPLDASYTDGSTTNVTVNKMKAGRVVPVKLTIWDVCTQSYLTDPTASVLINVFASNANGVDSIDAVESYADAGASSGNTRNFRWTVDATAPGGGFWIYNLDSRTVINGGAMLVGTTYRVDVWAGAIGGDKVTTNDWAYLAATK